MHSERRPSVQSPQCLDQLVLTYDLNGISLEDEDTSCWVIQAICTRPQVRFRHFPRTPVDGNFAIFLHREVGLALGRLQECEKSPCGFWLNETEEKVVREIPTNSEFFAVVAFYDLKGAATGQFGNIDERCAG